MAINLLLQYPGQVDPVTPAFPYGEPRNITAPGDGLGTPWEAAIIKDIVGLQQALLKSAGIVPSGTPDEVGASEYLQALTSMMLGGALNFDDSGVVNAYIADPRTNQAGPRVLFDGLTILFTPGSNNTGPTTIDVSGLGAVGILSESNLFPLSGGEFINGRVYKLTYDGAGFWRLTRRMRHDLSVINSDGTAEVLPIGWTSTKVATGQYEITHGYGVTPSEIGGVVTAKATTSINGVVNVTTGNSYLIEMWNSTTGVKVDSAFTLFGITYD